MNIHTTTEQSEDGHKCAFCGDTGAGVYGTAELFNRWPSEVDKEEQCVQFDICLGCAMSNRTNAHKVEDKFRAGDRKYLQTCDVCGGVGCRTASVRSWANNKPEGAVDDRTHRIKTVFSWSVDILEFSGSTTVCSECMPVTHYNSVKRPDWDYDDDAPALITPPFDADTTVSTTSVESDSKQVGVTDFVSLIYILFR